MSPVIKRHSIRALLLTRNREILLLRIVPPGGRDAFWIAPGGAVEPGETIEAGLRRELMEELGFKDFVIGHEVWRRQHTFSWGEKRLCQSEQYYIVHIDRRFEPFMSDATEKKTLDRFHWWPVGELAAAPERLVPVSLAAIITRYLAHGPPTGPLETEVLVD